MAPRTRCLSCSNSSFWSAVICSSATCSPSMPYMPAKNKAAKPVTALENSRASSS